MRRHCSLPPGRTAPKQWKNIMGRLDAIAVSTMQASLVDEVPAVRIGAGCTRRDLSSDGTVRVWVVDMEPGSTWPYVDDHDTGEHYYVIEGEVIEGRARHGAGTYVRFLPGTKQAELERRDPCALRSGGQRRVGGNRVHLGSRFDAWTGKAQPWL